MQFPFLFFCDHFRNFLWQLNLKREFQKKNFGMIFFWGHVYVELRVSLQAVSYTHLTLPTICSV